MNWWKLSGNNNINNNNEKWRYIVFMDTRDINRVRVLLRDSLNTRAIIPEFINCITNHEIYNARLFIVSSNVKCVRLVFSIWRRQFNHHLSSFIIFIFSFTATAWPRISCQEIDRMGFKKILAFDLTLTVSSLFYFIIMITILIYFLFYFSYLI